MIKTDKNNECTSKVRKSGGNNNNKKRAAGKKNWQEL
jgi:hypothetical protein